MGDQQHRRTFVLVCVPRGAFTPCYRPRGVRQGSKGKNGPLANRFAANQAAHSLTCRFSNCCCTRAVNLRSKIQSSTPDVSTSRRCSRCGTLQRTTAVIFARWVFFLISLGSPHVHRVGYTCRGPNGLESRPTGLEVNGPRSAPCSEEGPSAVRRVTFDGVSQRARCNDAGVSQRARCNDAGGEGFGMDCVKEIRCIPMALNRLRLGGGGLHIHQ